MSTVPNDRLPIEPLMAAVGVHGISDFARFIGVSRRTVHRMKKAGLTVWQADFLAVKKAGSHPIAVWGDAYEDPKLWGSLDTEWIEAA